MEELTKLEKVCLGAKLVCDICGHSKTASCFNCGRSLKGKD